MSVESLQILISAVNEASAPIRAIQDQIESLQNTSRNFQQLGQSITGVGQNMTRNVTLPIIAGLGAAGYAAVRFESQMADLNKAYSFDNGSKQAAAAQEVIMGLSQELRQMPSDVIAIATEAGKLGVKFNQLEDYTRTVTAASVAFDVSAEKAGESMAVLTNVLGYQDAQGRVNIEGLQSLGDAINYFADTGATSEAAIMSVLQRAGGATRIFGLANESATSLGAAFLNLGYPPEVVGTAMNSMLPALQNATQGTAEFKGALEQIGLPAQEFEQMVKKDAVGAITTFLDAAKASGDTSIIGRMFGTGADSAMLSSALVNLDAFKKTLLDVENIPAGSMMETFAKRQETTEAALEGMKASVMRMGIAVGSTLLPALNDIASAVEPLVNGFTAFAEANPGIIRVAAAIALVAAAVGPVLIVIGSLVTAVGAIGGAIAGIGGFLTLVSAMAAGAVPAAGFAGAVAGIATAIAGIGIGPILIVVAALAAGAALIIANWQPISAFFQSLWSGIVAAMQPVLQFSQGFAQGFMVAIQPLMPALLQMGVAFQQIGMSVFQLVGSFAQMIGGILQFAGAIVQLTPAGLIIGTIASSFTRAGGSAQSFGATVGGVVGFVVSGIARVAAAALGLVATFVSVGNSIVSTLMGIAGRAFAAGANIVQRIAAGIRSAIGAVTSAVASVGSAIMSHLPNSPVPSGPLTALNNIGSNPGAKIVQMISAGMGSQSVAPAIAGAVSPAVGGMGVSPSGGAIGAGGSSPITVNVTVNGAGGNAQEIGDSLEERLRSLLPRLMADNQRYQSRVAYS